MTFTREAVLESLRAEEVAAHYDLGNGPWRGRWRRSRRCPTQDHNSDAFGLARDGMWHCWSCDVGGDLLKLIALAENIDIKADFSRVLEIAAGIAGIVADDDFGGGKPEKKTRPALPPLPSIRDRLEVARKRAPWIWERLGELDRVGSLYLTDRGLEKFTVNPSPKEFRSTPMRVDPALVKSNPDLERAYRLFAPMGVAVPVRSPIDGVMVDIRVRRIEPRDGQPKIVGMLGGVCRDGAELLGCYGNPDRIQSKQVIVAEGIFDYLSARALWPHASVLGAVEAGSLPLVARHAAKSLAAMGGGEVVLVCQRDEESTDEQYRNGTPARPDGKSMPNGAADRAVDEATKIVMSILGVQGCAWVQCGPQHKDLNQKMIGSINRGTMISILRSPAPLASDDFGE